MRSHLGRVAISASAVLLFFTLEHRTVAQQQRDHLTIATQTSDGVREWDRAVTGLQRDDTLRLRQERSDSLVRGRVHERLDQYYKGVRVFGGDVARQLDGGVTVSIFGTLYRGIDVDTVPGLGPDEARAVVESSARATLGDDRRPELVILPTDAGDYRLAYRLRALGPDGLFVYFVDAHTGSILLAFNDLKSETAIGLGRGVLGDRKKLSVSIVGSTNRAIDEMRPPLVTTYDMGGSVNRTIAFLNGAMRLGVSDVASDSDNDWSDGAAVDAHAHAGLTYDYYMKRFGRRGLDNRDIPIVSLVHPASRDEIGRYPGAIIGIFILNAAYFGDGVMVYGEGLPPGATDSAGRTWNYTSGALDIVAHELTHGVTDYSSQLIYRDESGALNEAFSDIMAVGAEFFYQRAGDGLLRADYLMGEDVITPGGIRSLANPTAYGDPDHYSERFLGSEDNGGVHINSGIANHAYYLAIEGGTHRLSRQTVLGVGSANREQIEKVFYRAFTQMLPSNANFSVARAATIQAARDLYGPESAPERAITQAWTAVGVN